MTPTQAFSLRRTDGGKYIVSTDGSQAEYPTLGAALDSIRAKEPTPCNDTVAVRAAKQAMRDFKEINTLREENQKLRDCIVRLVLERYGGAERGRLKNG